MNAPGKIVLYFIAVFVLGALLSPPLYWGAQKLVPMAESRGWIQYETNKEGEREAKGKADFLASDFSKVSNRAHLLVALALLWPLFRSLKIRSASELGLEKNPHRWFHFALGFGVSVGVMAILGVVLLQLGVYKMKDSPPWGELLGILGSGIAVGLLEEWMFRGAILGSFRKTFGDWLGLFLVSALFSILHFLKPPEQAITDVGWLSGFHLLPQRFSAFSEPLLVLGGFATLFAFGWVCGWAAIRTRALALGIGFHAGMVLGKFGFNRVTIRPKKMRDLLPWIGEDITVGVVGLGVVLLVGLILWLVLLRFPRRPSAAQNSTLS